MIQNKLYRKLFLSPYYFTIAISRKKHSILEQPAFHAQVVLPGKPGRWSADPMLIEWQGKTYLFYEGVRGKKGRLEVAQVFDDCTISEPTVILEDACHYSYPFVFRWENTWYMIPESSASTEVRLYEAEAFPTQWKLKTVLLQEKAVDTTVMETENGLVLLTYLLTGKTERVHPRAYALELHHGAAALTPLTWEHFDELKCRGAGPALRENGKLYRPAQVSTEQQYGNAVQFYQVTETNRQYEEHAAAVLLPEHISAANVWFDGLHTYTETERFAAVDLRCRKFDFLKVPRMAWHRLIGK